MPKPLSIDLRERVLAAVAGECPKSGGRAVWGGALNRDQVGCDLARERPRPSPHRGWRPTFASDRDPRRGDSGVAGGDPRCHAGRSDGRPCASAWPPGEPQHSVAILCASGHHVQEEDRARLRAGTPPMWYGADRRGGLANPIWTLHSWSSSMRPGRRPRWHGDQGAPRAGNAAGHRSRTGTGRRRRSLEPCGWTG